MTFVAPESAPTPTTRVPSIAILGADALLAALPATAVQLAHACMHTGYQNVVPATWGDELIAAAALRALERLGELPAIQCSCPFVAHRLLAAGTDLRPFLLSLVAPPVALARYLRAAHAPAKLRITFIGRCPGAADESIDARLTPEELLAMLSDRGISLDDQPRVFDSVLPPDRRRHRSQPGGLPTPEMLWSSTGSANGTRRSLVELHGDELSLELAQHLLAEKPVLIDVAAKLGCLCSGATPGADLRRMRAGVIALEPPRAPSPVIDESVRVELELPLPASPRSAIDIVSPPTTSAARSPGADAAPPSPELGASNGNDDAEREERPHSFRAPPGDTVSGMPRRHSPPRGIARPMSGALPTARDANGRQLPRTYVARRRSPARGGRVQAAETHGAQAPEESTPAPVSVTVEPEVVGAHTLAADPSGERQAPNPPSVDATPVGPRAPVSPLGEPSSGTAAPRGDPPAAPGTPLHGGGRGGAGPSMVGMGMESTAPVPPVGRVGPAPEEGSAEDVARYRERAVQLPVTPRSDATKRETPPAVPARTGERALAQLLVFALLISTIVLVSAAVGVVVGRWMAQR